MFAFSFQLFFFPVTTKLQDFILFVKKTLEIMRRAFTIFSAWSYHNFGEIGDTEHGENVTAKRHRPGVRVDPKMISHTMKP